MAPGLEPVRQVLAHQAGLATIGQRLRLVDLAYQDRLAALIASQQAPAAPSASPTPPHRSR